MVIAQATGSEDRGFECRRASRVQTLQSCCLGAFEANKNILKKLSEWSLQKMTWIQSRSQSYNF
jgi:hypothetical protein